MVQRQDLPVQAAGRSDFTWSMYSKYAVKKKNHIIKSLFENEDINGT